MKKYSNGLSLLAIVASIGCGSDSESSMPSTGGAAGFAGSATGGFTWGTGGASAGSGGVVNMGGAAGSAGAPGGGGDAGTGGKVGTGGSAGNGGSAASGGSAGSAGTGGSAGSAGTGGSAGSGSSGGTGGGPSGKPNWVLFERKTGSALWAVGVFSDGSFGTPQMLDSSQSQYWPLWAKDQELLAVDGANVRIFNMKTGTPVLLDTIAGPAGNTGLDSWSKDAKKLVYWTSASSKITSLVYDRFTKKSVKLADGPPPFGLQWSGDGKWLSWRDQKACKVIDSGTGAVTSVMAPAKYSSVVRCDWAFDGSFILMAVRDNNGVESAVVVPFSKGSFGTLIDLGMRATLSPTANLAVLTSGSGSSKLAKVDTTGIKNSAPLASTKGPLSYSTNWNSTGTRVMLTRIGEAPVLVDATSWPPGVAVGTVLPGGISVSYGYPTERWFGIIYDASMYVIDGAVTSSVSVHQLANDLSINSSLGYFKFSSDGTALLMRRATAGLFDPPNPYRFVDLSGAAPAASVQLPSNYAAILSRGAVRYVVYRDDTDQGLRVQKILSNGSLGSPSLVTGTLQPVQWLGVQP